MKIIIIFTALSVCFVFSNKLINATGFEDFLRLRSKSATLNDGGFVYKTMELIKDLGLIKGGDVKLRYYQWGLYKCKCGEEKEIRTSYVKSGRTVSCGCVKNTHGMSDTRVYKIWNGMKARCSNSNKTSFDCYGGRGITVCKEWLMFVPFMEWAMKNGYKDNLTIERVNNNGNYEPANCTWIPFIEQWKNRRTPKSNTSGYLGVSFDKQYNKYHAYCTINAERRTVGRRYNTAKEASIARGIYIKNHNND